MPAAVVVVVGTAVDVANGVVGSGTVDSVGPGVVNEPASVVVVVGRAVVVETGTMDNVRRESVDVAT